MNTFIISWKLFTVVLFSQQVISRPQNFSVQTILKLYQQYNTRRWQKKTTTPSTPSPCSSTSCETRMCSFSWTAWRSWPPSRSPWAWKGRGPSSSHSSPTPCATRTRSCWPSPSSWESSFRWWAARSGLTACCLPWRASPALKRPLWVKNYVICCVEFILLKKQTYLVLQTIEFSIRNYLRTLFFK